ncbi:MAG: multiheme c-type cytochrome [Planctomycetota bacterium]
MSVRGALGLVVAGLGVWLVVLVFRGEPGAAAPPAAFTSSAQCKECHPQVYAEWEASPHANAWVNEAVRSLSNDFANQDCIACHAPRGVFDVGVGERMLPRNVRRMEGVDCLTCHQLPEGGMAGTITDPRAACRPVERIELTRPEFCAGCHNQHKTVDQWRGSKWPDQDQDCRSCHMPFRDGTPESGRSHAMPGGTSLDFLQRAIALSGERVDGGWLVRLANVGAGHAFPTDERSRASDVFWRPIGDLGKPGVETWRHLDRMRSPYRTETDLEDTLLQAHEVREFTITDPDAADGIEVAWFYKRSPYWADAEHPDPDREATLVHRLELRP